MASAAYDNLAAKAAGNAVDLTSKIYGVDNWDLAFSHQRRRQPSRGSFQRPGAGD